MKTGAMLLTSFWKVQTFLFFFFLLKQILFLFLFLFYLEYQPPKPGSTGVAGVQQIMENRVHCDYGKPPGPGKACEVDLEKFTPCTGPKQYMYPDYQPCIFLKLNKVSFHD